MGDLHQPTTWRLGHRPGLDALRGVAVLLVLFGHFGVIAEAWATVGVMLFFVLSGYLITALLLVETGDTGRVDLAAFYVRRARRLLPALVILLVVLGVLAGVRGELHRWLPGAVPVMLYVGNWGYLAGVVPHELWHTWSLAIEEQFYLLWPAAVILLLRRGWLLTGTIALAILSVASILPWFGTFEVPYYASPQRAVDLLAGALVAILAVRWNRDPTLHGLTALVCAGSVAILTLMGGAPEFGMLLFPLPLAVIVAWFAAHPHRFAWRPLTETGRISYGLYLYHYPLIGLAPALVLFPLTYGLAVASWVLVERRLIRRRTGPVPVPPAAPHQHLLPGAPPSAERPVAG